jgi:hypothetical protein
MSKMHLCLFGATLAMLCTPAIIAPSTASAASVSECRGVQHVCIRSHTGDPNLVERCQRVFDYCMRTPTRTGGLTSAWDSCWRPIGDGCADRHGTSSSGLGSTSSVLRSAGSSTSQTMSSSKTIKTMRKK